MGGAPLAPQRLPVRGAGLLACPRIHGLKQSTAPRAVVYDLGNWIPRAAILLKTDELGWHETTTILDCECLLSIWKMVQSRFAKRLCRGVLRPRVTAPALRGHLQYGPGTAARILRLRRNTRTRICRRGRGS